jgi:hypothetical protein
MTEHQGEFGEIRCMLCGRHLADIQAHEDGRLQLMRPNAGAKSRASVRVDGGRLHCTHCGGRAFVEWDLLPSSRTRRGAWAA